MVSEQPGLPNLASMRLYDLVGPPGGTDTCRLHFELSMLMRWIWMAVGQSVVMGSGIGWLGYVGFGVACVSLVLTISPS